MQRLPDEALTRNPVDYREQQRWTPEMELLAQLIEVTSIPASGRQLKKPLEVPRPKRAPAAASDSATVVQMDGYKRAVGVLQATSKGVRRD